MNNLGYWVFSLLLRHSAILLFVTACLCERGYVYLVTCASQSDYTRWKKPPTPQVPLARSPSSLLRQGLHSENRKQLFSTFLARNGSHSVSRHQTNDQHHHDPCPCLCISIRLTHSPSQETLASAKLCLVLEKWGHPEGNYHSCCWCCLQPRKLHWCWCSLGPKGRDVTQP